MRPLSREEIEAGKEESFYTSAFVSVNPGYALMIRLMRRK